MIETAIEIGHHYRVTGDQNGKIIEIFNIVEDTLLVGGVLFDPETNGMQYTQGFAPTDPAWADHGHVHIDPNAPEIYREQIGDEASYDQLHTLAVRAWHEKIFDGPESP